MLRGLDSIANFLLCKLCYRSIKSFKRRRRRKKRHKREQLEKTLRVITMAANDKQRPTHNQLADQHDEPILHGCTVRYYLLGAGVMHSAMAAIFAKMSEDSLRLAFSPASRTAETESESCGHIQRPTIQSDVIDLSVKRSIQDHNCVERIQPEVPSHVLPPCLPPNSVGLAGSTTAIKTPGDSRYENLDYGCEKKFRSHNSLVNHYRTHTGERPFVCDFPGCWQAFARQSNLITHRLVHLDREMRRKFICPVGGCGRNFLKKTNLEDHLNLHLGRRPYKCEHPGCAKAFRCRSNLSGHRRVHLRAKETGASTQSSALEKRIEMILARAVDSPDGQQPPI
ncbi:unnamed protein product [Dibothriocephalus latus]|uniref:C2H2-type domain-containing protein n=1 Tax=Dibothriocephalus latus TaxID=60516 RepID=A0A3P7P9V1_DIBLA|nr:unnamed protein product [Dibothriocephalus latus]